MATAAPWGAQGSDRRGGGVETRSRATFNLADRPPSDSLEARSAPGLGWRSALLDLSEEFLTRARALDDAGLSRRLKWYKMGVIQPLAMRIVRTTTHDIYHAGQIMYVRALQGIPPR
jgi:uncharacterized damage-inducible protein DinB